MNKISIIVPMYFEENNIQLCYDRVKKVMLEFKDFNHEIIFVNDGSTDKSWSIMTKIAKEDYDFKPINLSRNFGQQVATTAGLSKCTGDFAFIIDGDLQHPPELFQAMMTKLQGENLDSVYVIQHSKKKISFVKRITSYFFYHFFNALSTVKIPRNTGDFRLINRKMIDVYLSLPEKYRFIRGNFAWMGFKQGYIDLNLPVREHGESKFTFIKSLNLALDGLFSYSTIAARAIGIVTLIFGLLFIISLVIGVVSKLIFTALFGIVLLLIFCTTMILFSLTIMTEYLLRTYIQVLDRPIFVIQEQLNLDK